MIAILLAIVWFNGTDLPIEGRAFDDVEFYYDRLPGSITTNVNPTVRDTLRHCSAGMQFRFVTDSPVLHFRWTPFFPDLAMDHMPATGVSGIDVYRFDEALGKWRYQSTGRITDSVNGGTLDIGWTAGVKCLVNLPLYNGVKSFEIGVDDGFTLTGIPARAKPIVFYGTSITQGGCCSRPGNAFVNIVGRRLDAHVVNLGFSGSGVMEYELSDVMAHIDAGCFVIDSLWNMGDGLVVERYEAFIRNLRAKRPNVPILLVEQCDVYCSPSTPKDLIVKGIYEKLLAEGWIKLSYLPKQGMYANDFEGTVDGCHPNDYGMMYLADAFTKAIAETMQK